MPPRKKTAHSNVRLQNLRTRWVQWVLFFLLLSGFGLRMIDLTDPPLDFHPTRQYHGALVARSIYYQMAPVDDTNVQKQALAQRYSVAQLEPPILESLVALAYFVAGGEYLWIARIITSFLWVLAAVPLYALAAHMTSPTSGLIVAAYYLFLPFAVQASRSFQPDPFMVAMFIVAMFATYRWSEKQEWKWALLAGIASGLAFLIKAVAAYLILGVLAASVLYTLGVRAALRNRQVWVMVLITILPAGLYYVLGIGGTSGNYFQNWIVALLPLAFRPVFYVRWVNILTDLLGMASLVVALSGLLIAQSSGRWLLIGAWFGYGVYGITLPYQTITHSYYHLQLVPIAALSIAPVVDLTVKRVIQQTRPWQALFAFLAVSALVFAAGTARSDMLSVDYRNEPVFWERIGKVIPMDGKTIGLIQDYGNLLNYYGWRHVKIWPVTGELALAGLRGNSIEDFEGFFLERTMGMDYFLITAFNQLEQQPLLQEYLADHYSIYAEGDGYVIYDLHRLLSLASN